MHLQNVLQKVKEKYILFAVNTKIFNFIQGNCLVFRRSFVRWLV